MTPVKKLVSGLENKYRLYTLLAPFMMVGEVAMEIFIPLIMSRIIDTGITNRDISYVLRLGFIMITASCFSLVCGMLCARFAAIASQGFSRNLRRRLFAKIEEFSFANTDHFTSASLVTRLTTDVTNTQNVYQMFIRMFIRAPLMLVSGTTMAFLINRRLAVMFVVAIPLLGFILVMIVSTAYPRFRKMLEKYDDLNNTVQENLTGIRVVKSFVRGSHEITKFEHVAAAVRDTQVRAEKIVIFTMPVMQLVIYSCIVSVLWFGGNMIIDGTMHTGELVSFIAYVTQVLMSLMMLSMVFVMIVISRASISRIIEVLDEKIDIENPAVKSLPPDRIPDAAHKIEPAVPPASAFRTVQDGSVIFRNVSFSYNRRADNCVLNHIDLHIESGQYAGIIGSTGSSKTTLVQLIPRLYDVLSGSVQVGGIDVRAYDLVPLRDSVAMVLQKNVLFSGTIRDNLCWGNMHASDEEVVAACRAADAYEFIMSFPEGFNTELGQGGVNLSGGQKQRLCIARALLKNPKILILDDSTSAVDTATESRIRIALSRSLPETTKIVIAQRITSVKDADIIYVMDEGCINGSGTHVQLLNSNRIYREVYDSQQKDSEKGGNALCLQ